MIASWKRVFAIFCLLLAYTIPCSAADQNISRQELFRSDLRTAPRIWFEGLKSFAQPTELILLGSGAAIAILAWQFEDDITESIQRHSNYQGFSSIGDVYGKAISLGIPQVSIYAAGLATKNEKIREFGLLTTHTAIVSGVMTLVLKGIVNSDRPDGSSRRRLDSSFPSGHALGSAALAGTIHQRYGFWYAVPFQLASLFTGLSRVTDNEHRPLDVVAGWGFGYATGYAIARAWEKLQLNTSNVILMPWVDPATRVPGGLALQVTFWLCQTYSSSGTNTQEITSASSV